MALNIANDVAREQPAASVEGHVDLQESLSHLTSATSPDALDSWRGAHAQQWSATMLRNADLDPVAQVQQNQTSPDGDLSVASDVTRNINEQALANATATAERLRAMGFSPDAIARAQELVRHHSVSGAGTSNVQRDASQDQPEALVDPQPMAIAEQEALAETEPSATQQDIAEPESQLDAEPLEIEAAIADRQQELDSEQVAEVEPLAVSAGQEIEDPLADSPYMTYAADVEQPVAVAEEQATGLTAETSIAVDAQINAEIASLSERLDFSFGSGVDREQSQPATQPELESKQEALAQEVAPGLRFDYQPEQGIEAEARHAVRPPAAAINARLDEELAIAPEPFKLRIGEPNRTIRDGDARVSVYPLAA